MDIKRKNVSDKAIQINKGQPMLPTLFVEYYDERTDFGCKWLIPYMPAETMHSIFSSYVIDELDAFYPSGRGFDRVDVSATIYTNDEGVDCLKIQNVINYLEEDKMLLE